MVADSVARLGPRERLLEAADELFYREGVHTVGIDRLLEHAGVAKGSLYSTFGSKEELVGAYLARRAERLQARIEKHIEGIADPRRRAVAVFDSFVERVAEGDYLGCPFVRACAETPRETNRAVEVSASFRKWRLALFERLAEEWRAESPGVVAKQLSMLYDGAAVAVGMDGDTSAAEAARDAAARLAGVRDRAPPKRAATSSRRSK